MASAAPNMVNKMKTSSRGELMGLISMLKQKYHGDTFKLPMFDLNSVRSQLHTAFTEKAPSNLQQLEKMVMAVGKGNLPLDQLQTMMYKNLKVMIEVEHTMVDITSANKPVAKKVAANKKVATYVSQHDGKILSDTTAHGVRTVVRQCKDGNGTTTTKTGRSTAPPANRMAAEYQKKEAERMRAARIAETVKA